MSGAQWPFTNLGIRFFEGQLPELTRNIGKLADELKRYNDAAEKDRNSHTQPENAEAYIAAADDNECGGKHTWEVPEEEV